MPGLSLRALHPDYILTLKEGDSMADHAASSEPEPDEPMKVPYGSDKLLSWVSIL